MGKSYVGDVGTVIILDCGCDISSATNTKMLVQRPDGEEVEWEAEIYNSQYLKYTIEEDDWDISGTYEIQAYLTLGGWTGRGETAEIEVYGEFVI